MSRGIARRRLRLYPHVREVLDVLRGRYPLALVTDAQSAYARGKLHKVGLLDYFDPIVVSGDHGFRKPDRRLFQLALDGMGVAPGNALYVGNDMHRDIFGAREAGMTTVLFESGQGATTHPDCVPDYRITDPRDLLGILACGGLEERAFEPTIQTSRSCVVVPRISRPTCGTSSSLRVATCTSFCRQYLG
jgi:putative hydrolase of the HAD superfamily